MSIRDIAQTASTYFEIAIREDDILKPEYYERLKGDAPEWVRDIVREAHGYQMPNDWRYSCIRGAVEALAEDEDFDSHEFADSACDTYNNKLIEWLSRGGSESYCEEAQEQGLVGEDTRVFDLIRAGQYVEALEVFNYVYSEIEALASDDEFLADMRLASVSDS